LVKTSVLKGVPGSHDIVAEVAAESCTVLFVVMDLGWKTVSHGKVGLEAESDRQAKLVVNA